MYRLFVFALAVGTVFSFTATTGPKQITALSAGRRAFLDVSLTAGAATLVGISQPTFAESTDDLSMPSEEEQQKLDMEERLRQKAELKKKVAKPTTYQGSFQSEMEKQKSLQKTKEEKRNAMCEELGRGC
mmetsp:Transcript_3072/g.4657  ORF Transcript_3072/g.4657 Transcript_3072/m.4657 type:complete len:130 (+) Transcript_3072:130-519(+)|eukprot:CAMPEP_0194209914 /NCGR_PEP_ID=MMETSP0156-20130528/7877_1 /TAXON_ID=33649 /ORGANISM="Thalassionema nitzschioides, Strain L26-B" /LENGTH=129 /DNA_ID=CAMNT_0038937171 /DNA_START=109 /DNA_END=498 /DNA_ORIENTATION=-